MTPRTERIAKALVEACVGPNVQYRANMTAQERRYWKNATEDAAVLLAPLVERAKEAADAAVAEWRLRRARLELNDESLTLDEFTWSAFLKALEGKV